MNEFASLEKPKNERAQMTVTLPAYLTDHVDDLAKKYGMTKSAVVAAILEFDRRKRIEAEMAEGYVEMWGEQS